MSLSGTKRRSIDFSGLQVLLETYGVGADERLTPKELAQVLGIDYGVLTKWRKRGKGPPYIKLGGLVFYPKGALEEWLKANMYGV